MSLDKVIYVFNEIKKHWRDRFWWKGRILYRIIVPILFRRNDGIYILDEDWDNLIILDACRYDVFKELNIIDGKLEYRISRGCHTREFLRENFNSGKFQNIKFNDIVYITANPWVTKLLHGKFYKIINVWDEGWDDELCTVKPSTVYEYAIDALSKYPGKRFIIHFLQPHLPFLNPAIYDLLGEDVKSKIESSDGKISDIFGTNEIKIKKGGRRIHPIIRNLWERGKLDRNIIFKGYKENLALTMPYVKKLVDVLPGKTVVTSDHGEAFGEFVHPLIPLRIDAHSEKIRINSLIKVPWLIVEKPHRFKVREKEKIRGIVRKISKKKEVHI